MSNFPIRAIQRAAEGRKALAEALPWTLSPLVVSAPMRVFTGPALAVAVARAGGLGFIGPGMKPESTLADLAEAKEQLEKRPHLFSSQSPSARQQQQQQQQQRLPVGVGFQVWNGDLGVACKAVREYQPCAVWLFAPRDGQPELDVWTLKLREASPATQIWIQVGTLHEALAAASVDDSLPASSPARDAAAVPDALVVQGAESGGHGRANDGVGIISLLPEIADALVKSQPVNRPGTGQRPYLIAAGGIADGRGVAAALGLGASAVAMGTRFLASHEARISAAYQQAVVDASDGAHSTGRTQLYNHLRGTFGWPAAFSPRGLLNLTWSDHCAGTPFDELQRRHDAAVQAGGSAAWGPNGRTSTYAGASVGLVHSVQDAEAIVTSTREDARQAIQRLADSLVDG